MKLTPAQIALCSSQAWRLQNLYSCREEGTGKALPFRPRAEQQEVYRCLIEEPQVPLYIIKSRRLGISTAVDTFQADSAVFNQGWRGVIIDLKQDDATKKMVEIVRFAVDSIPRDAVTDIIFDKRNDSELRLRLSSEREAEDSVIYAITGGRGSDCSMLHVSEWGPISAVDPTRSKEIRTGAYPAARKGRRVVETTWYGGKTGDLWEMIKPLLEGDPNAEGRVLFFPWHSDPQAFKTTGMLTPEIEHYFKELAAKTAKTFSREQKLWYAAKQIEQGIFVKREYPSSLEEAFSAPVEGSIYGDIIMERRGAGRIIPFDYDASYPVYSSWDIGWNDATVVWLWQIVGRDLHWIWHTKQVGYTASEMAKLLSDTGIPITAHYLPHDSVAKSPGEGQSYLDALTKAGLVNLIKVNRVVDIWTGINALREMLKRSWFRMPYCEAGITALEAYHTKPATAGGIISREPVHDDSSHDASAARCAAEAIELGLVKGASARAVLNAAPRYPDGAIVDLEHVIEKRQARRTGLAKSNISR